MLLFLQLTYDYVDELKSVHMVDEQKLDMKYNIYQKILSLLLFTELSGQLGCLLLI